MVSQRLALSQIDAPTTELPRIGVAAQVVVQAVAAEHAFLAEMAKLGVADRAGRTAMIHRVAAHAVRVGRLDDDVAAQVGDLAAVVAGPQMLEFQRFIEADDGRRRWSEAVRSSVKESPRRRGLPFSAGLRRGDNDMVARPPAFNRLSAGHGRIALLGRRAEFDPGAIHDGAVKVHTSAAADNGRQRLLVHSGKVDKSDHRRMFCVDGPICASRLPGPASAEWTAPRWASQSKPSSLTSSPAWMRIKPTSRRVSLSGANVSTPAMYTARTASCETRS